VRELEYIIEQKNAEIQQLQARLASKEGGSGTGRAGDQNMRRHPSAPSSPQAPRRTGNRNAPVDDAGPMIAYTAVDQDDPVDIRLEEYYNSTNSAIPFRRINRGFYRFGETICELKIINHKLMAATEDGWNRGKFGPIEKFMTHYENIEREKAGLLDE